MTADHSTSKDLRRCVGQFATGVTGVPTQLALAGAGLPAQGDV